MLYIILKQVIWRSRLYNLFAKIYQKYENMSNNKFRNMKIWAIINFGKFKKAPLESRFDISRNKLYIFSLHITCFKMIYNMFMFYEFDIFSNSWKWPKFRQFPENLEIKILCRYLKWIGLSDKFPIQWFIVCWSHVSSFKNYRGGGRPAPPQPLILQKCVVLHNSLQIRGSIMIKQRNYMIQIASC